MLYDINDIHYEVINPQQRQGHNNSHITKHSWNQLNLWFELILLLEKINQNFIVKL